MDRIVFRFLGDISLNGSYKSLMARQINPFANLRKALSKSDYIVGNVECLLESREGENTYKRPRLSTDIRTFRFLNDIGVNIACLANNHAFDNLKGGFEESTEFFRNSGILYLGCGATESEARRPMVISQNGVCIGILNYVTKDTNPNVPTGAAIRLNYYEIDNIKEDIGSLRDRVDQVFVILHWGGRVEGGHYPDYPQPKEARKIIDAGADLIIGHHSHAIQPFEVYKGKYIFYGLGNFCFSDFYFESRLYKMTNRMKTAAIVSVVANKNTYQVETDYYRNNITSYSKKLYYPISEKARGIIFKNFMGNSFLWRIYYLQLKNVYPFIRFIIRPDISFADKARRMCKSIYTKVAHLI